MAKRTVKPYHAEKTKDLIRASQLLNRLNDFANGKCELTQAQVNAAKIVIAKAIPDLKQIEHVGDPERPVHHAVTQRPKITQEQWMKTHGLGSPAGSPK